MHSLPLATPRAALETEPPALHSAVPPANKTISIVDIGYIQVEKSKVLILLFEMRYYKQQT